MLEASMGKPDREEDDDEEDGDEEMELEKINVRLIQAPPWRKGKDWPPRAAVSTNPARQKAAQQVAGELQSCLALGVGICRKNCAYIDHDRTA